MSKPEDKHITVPIGDDPSLREVADRAKMQYLGRLMDEEGSDTRRVAERLGCTVVNIYKAVRYAVNKYGSNP